MNKLKLAASYLLEGFLFLVALVAFPLTGFGELFCNSISEGFRRIDEWREEVKG